MHATLHERHGTPRCRFKPAPYRDITSANSKQTPLVEIKQIMKGLERTMPSTIINIPNADIDA